MCNLTTKIRKTSEKMGFLFTNSFPEFAFFYPENVRSSPEFAMNRPKIIDFIEKISKVKGVKLHLSVVLDLFTSFSSFFLVLLKELHYICNHVRCVYILFAHGCMWCSLSANSLEFI